MAGLRTKRGGAKKGERRGGRKKGIPNRTSTEIGMTLRSLARTHTVEAVKKLVTLMRSAKNQMVQARCADALLDRAWGRPPQAVALTGAKGGPIATVSYDHLKELPASELARLYRETLETTRESEEEPEGDTL